MNGMGETSPSRLFFSVDIKQACEIGTVGDLCNGPKDHLGTNEDHHLSAAHAISSGGGTPMEVDSVVNGVQPVQQAMTTEAYAGQSSCRRRKRQLRTKKL